MITRLFSVFLLGMNIMAVQAQPDGVNYDEANVPAYTLPDPLTGESGNRITTADEWRTKQRPYLLGLVQSQIYGEQLAADVELSVTKAVKTTASSMRRKQITIRLSRGGQHVDLMMLMYLPTTTKPVATFVGLNFMGNHTTTNDPDIPVTENWVHDKESIDYANNKASAKARGYHSNRWPYELITKHGYGVATIYYGDIDPDFDDGFSNGVHALFPDEKRDGASGGSISAWAWGMSRALDYLETDRDVDSSRVIVFGHSRLGKTALWAGAADQRFAMVISNDSGCSGAALSRRRFGETITRINTIFPHWFCDNYLQYNDAEDTCPVDQHSLIALIAPRPVLICSAEDDRWADPRGEFLSGKAAADVYRLLGTDGMTVEEFPGVNTPVMSRIGYHMRPGKHDVTPQDWKIFLAFADKHLSIAK